MSKVRALEWKAKLSLGSRDRVNYFGYSGEHCFCKIQHDEKKGEVIDLEMYPFGGYHLTLPEFPKTFVEAQKAIQEYYTKFVLSLLESEDGQ